VSAKSLDIQLKLSNPRDPIVLGRDQQVLDPPQLSQLRCSRINGSQDDVAHEGLTNLTFSVDIDEGIIANGVQRLE
jgi:hypothetical protein